MPSGTWLAGAGAALLLAGCATAPKGPPVAPPAPPPAPPPPSWEDMALTAGDWRFSGGPTARADYGEESAAAFSLRCDAPQRRILLVRTGAAAGSRITVRTTFAARVLEVGEGGASMLSAADAFLDGLVSSRGRIAIEAAGLPALILPTWPEPARVVEECRD